MQTKETCNYKQGERKIIIETERHTDKDEERQRKT